MITQSIYIKPKCETVELETQNTLMQGSGLGFGEGGTKTGHIEQAARERSFWDL